MKNRYFQHFPTLRVLAVALSSITLLSACSKNLPAQTAIKKPTAQLQSVATYGGWRSAPIGGGGYLQQVAFAPTNSKRIYMTSDVGGLFRSDNSGLTWRMLHGSLPADAGSYSVRGIAVDPRNEDRVLLGLGNSWGNVKGVWETTNGGASWRKLFDCMFEANGWYRSAGNVLVMSPRDPNFIIAAPLGGGIARSTNGGKTWTSSGPDDICPTAVMFDRANANRIWVCARPWDEYKYKRANGQEVGLRGGLFFSQDAGKTWTQLLDRSPNEMIQDPKNPAVLWGTMDEKRIVRSTDGGKTWIEYSNGLAPHKGGDARADGTYEAIWAGPDFLLVGGQGGHFYRLNSGATKWQKIEPTKIDEGNWWGRIEKFRHFGSALGFIAVDPRDPKHWVFTDWYALYQTWDAGKNWKLTIDGVEMTVLNTVAQEPTNDKVFHAGMADIGYFRSPDGGKTMQQITTDISNNIKHIAPALGQPGRVYATGPKTWEWYTNEVFISDDAGLSWRRSGLNGIPEMDTRRCETVVPHPAKKDEVWVTISGDIKPGKGGTWRSLDGGKTWAWAGEGLPQDGGFFHSNYWVAGPELAISPDGSMICSSNDRGLLARRGANDDKWTMVPVPAGGPNCLAADVLKPGRFYAAMKDGGLWRSDDGGRSWTNCIARDVHWVSADMKKPNRVVVNTSDRVLVSLDAGATWREMSRALPYRHSRNSVCFAGDLVVTGTGGNGVFYAPLSSLQGKATSLARPSTTNTTTNASTNNTNASPPIQMVQNGDMTRGTDTPSEWTLGSWKEGEVALKRDASTRSSSPASLLLETRGVATGVAQQMLQPTPKGDVTVSGQWKTQGTFDSVQVVLQVFDKDWKQLDWKTVADGPKTTSDWTSFSGTQSVRDDAAYVMLNLSVKGNGHVWLDDVSATQKATTQPNATPQNVVAALPVAIAANDSRLRYVGRFDWSDKAAPRCAWSASNVAIRFRGTDLNARLRGADNVRWQIEVDGKPTQKIKVGPGEALYRIASGLTNGEHTIRLVQATEALFGTTQILGWQLNQGARVLELPAAKRRLEVIGDSISAGYGNEAASKDEKFSPDTQNAYFTYGAMAARDLNAEYVCTAWSGKKMWPDNTLPELYDRTIPTEDNSRWEFAKWTPNAVLINLATNDFWGKNPDEAGWTTAYTSFIARIRKNYPNALIYCAVGPMMTDDGDQKALSTLRGYLAKIVANRKAAGDTKVKIIDFGTQDGNNGFGADWHPNIKTNRIMANQLTQTLRKDLGW